MQNSFFDQGQRTEFMNRLRAGEKMDCPCCRRHAQIYRRALHYSTAMQLIRLYRINGAKEFINANKLILEGQQGVGDFSKAKYWNLIERQPIDDETDKKSSGFWKLTGWGERFVLGKYLIKKYANIFDDEVISLEGDPVNIEHCLTEKFSYEKLMSP